MKHIIAVASGKGGVGKSTVAVNLAVALANRIVDGVAAPLKVALIDTDFYGPSVPTLMGGGAISGTDHEGRFIPPQKFGVKYMSIAFFLKNPDDAVVWRGPMFGKAMQQLFQDTSWGEVDVCIVDLPPGTGDAQLSLAQMVQLSGVVLVTTPQEVALSDVRRALNMFKKVNVPVIGVVENMSGFLAPDGTVHDIFGAGGGEAFAKEYSVEFLAKLPLEINVRKGGDEGHPIALFSESGVGKQFQELGNLVLSKLQVPNATPVLKVVN